MSMSKRTLLATTAGRAPKTREQQPARAQRHKMFAHNFAKALWVCLRLRADFYLCWKSLDSRFPVFTTAREHIMQTGPTTQCTCTAHGSGQLSHAQVQALDKCWHAEFGRMREPLVRAVRTAFPRDGFFDSLPRLYFGF